jgi:hypothetical protein
LAEEEKGRTVAEICRKHMITTTAFQAWRDRFPKPWILPIREASSSVTEIPSVRDFYGRGFVNVSNGPLIAGKSQALS